jgi:glutamyl-tRNA reductase
MQATSTATIDERWVDSLVMVGASLPARLGNGVPKAMEHLTPEQFRCVKRPQEEVPQLLRSVRSSAELEECWLWNTCSRFELYGWAPLDVGAGSNGCPLDLARTAVAGPKAQRASLNVLRGRDALHHLLRTAAGLNGGLPGDGEVVQQMEVALELAARSETTGPRTALLRDEVLACMGHLGESTAWGRFRPEYCTVALKRVALDLDVDWAHANCVIVGSSVTALSTVAAFREHFGVPVQNITVAYRNHRRGKLMKRLRAASRGGTRLRLDTYGDARLQEAIAEADVLVFATDSRTPIVRHEQLRAGRNLADRGLTIIDFNTFGSTDGAADLYGVRLVDAHRLEQAVGAFSDSLLECPAFATAAMQAEEGIREHLGRVGHDDDCDCATAPQPARTTDRALALCPGCPHRHALATCPRRLMTERIPA